MEVNRPSWGSTLVKNRDQNKTYILVKLSESFSNAIQEYSAGQNNQTKTNQFISANNNRQIEAPTIKFHGTRGAIRFPNGKSYDFSLEQSDNSVECIKQTKNKWESVGKMACCLHVKGKDDAYQRTRTKMEAAEQEKRKYCTKLLGSPKQNNSNPTTKPTKLLDTNSSSLLSSSSSSSSLKMYPDITDVKQLKRYKADFDKDFKEYKSLHCYLHRIEERFRKLRDSLKQSAEGSPEWELAKEQIFNEYERVKGDSNFHRARSKYKQLYNKLGHIKKKIFQYKRQKIAGAGQMKQQLSH